MLKQLRLDVRRLDQIVERVRVRKDQAGHREVLEHVVVVESINGVGIMHGSEGKYKDRLLRCTIRAKEKENGVRILPIHVEFRQLQDTKPYVEGFINPQASLLTLNCTEVIAVDSRIHELRLGHQLP